MVRTAIVVAGGEALTIKQIVLIDIKYLDDTITNMTRLIVSTCYGRVQHLMFYDLVSFLSMSHFTGCALRSGSN